jgi:hypothetical protein
MMKKIILSLLFSFWIVAAFAQTRQVVVSPNGNDNNTGAYRQPYLTLNKAQARVRELIAQGYKGKIEVILRAGTYNLSNTLIFNNQDVGSGVQIEWKGASKENVYITSYADATSWVLSGVVSNQPGGSAGKLYEYNTTGQPFSGFLISPTNSLLYHSIDAGWTPAYDDNTNPANLNTLHFPSGKIPNANLSDIYVSITPRVAYMFNVLKGFSSVNTGTNTAVTSVPASAFMTQIYSYYRTDKTKTAYLHNWIGNITQNTFVFNSTTNRIYLWPSGDISPNAKAYKIPKLVEFIRVEGSSPSNPVKNLSFTNLKFRWANAYYWVDADKGGLHDFHLVDANDAIMKLKNAESCRIQDCVFIDSGASGLRLDGHCRNITVNYCEFKNLGGNGIVVSDIDISLTRRSRNNVITNNSVDNIGWLHQGSSGIAIWQSGYNQVKWNELKNCPANGISICSGRSFHFNANYQTRREVGKAIVRPEVPIVDAWEPIIRFLSSSYNDISYNKLSNITYSGRINDTNGIYISSCGYYNRITFNYIKDCLGPGTWGGIRTDDQTRLATIENNIIRNHAYVGITIKHDNNKYNNNFILDLRSIQKADASILDVFGYLNPAQENYYYSQANRNIIYHLESGKQPALLKEDNAYANWYLELQADYNLYYPNASWVSNQNNADKTLGLDLNSVVTGASIFTDYNNEIYTFPNGSPALALGINPINVSLIGIRPKN